MANDQGNSDHLDDPWDLPQVYVLRKNQKLNGLQTYSGNWKEEEEERIAIRSAGESSSSASPSYAGVRKTLQFYLKDGTKTDWIMHEYHNLCKDDDGETLFLQEDVVLRKVFQKRKNKTDKASSSSVYNEVESFVNAYRRERSPYYFGYPYMADQMINCRRVLLPPIVDESLESGAQSFVALLHRLERNENFENGNLGVLNEDLGLQSEDLGVPCDLDGKSDNVWKHFTKIRGANDEVYAACHRCDKVLMAHPKKHGTSHLKRHIDKCSSCTNPSTDEDRVMLHRLRIALNDPNVQQKIDEMDCQEDLTELDPWDHPTPWYVTRPLNWQTQGGHWKEINKEVIRMDDKACWKDIIDKGIAVIQKHHQLQEQVPQPQYMGLRRTLRFHQHNGMKVDWLMFEYQQLDDTESLALRLQGCMVIRKVFQYDKDAVASAFSDLDRLLNADGGDEECFNGEGVNTDITSPSDYMDTSSSAFQLGEGVSTDTTTPSSDSMDAPVDRKRKRTGARSGRKSQVWMHFTKIYNTDRGVVYAVCHTCDRGYSSGRSSNGTSHLWRHNKRCASKRPRPENANDATTEWETEIWPLFLKYYGEHQPSGMC